VERRSAPSLIGLAALLTCGATGCYDTDVRPRPDVVFALFDPAAMPPQIPLPNDLTGQQAPPDAVAKASFSGLIDPTTITPQSVIVVDVTTMMPVLGVADPASTEIPVTPPPGGWPVGHRIAIAMVGSPSGLKGVGGIPVVASPAFFFARGTSPVSNCVKPAPDCVSATPALTVEQAIGLERLRQALAPLITALVSLGVPRDQLVLVWTFTISPNGGP
jgi:hypothetical protein